MQNTGSFPRVWEASTGSGRRIETRVANGVSKWIKRKDAGSDGVGPPRIIIDNRLCTMPNVQVESTIKKCMALFGEKGSTIRSSSMQTTRR